jgi:methionine-rich copper-binding protein CopC
MQDVIGIKEIPLRVAIKFREGTQRNISGVNQANTTLETGSTAHITTETSH